MEEDSDHHQVVTEDNKTKIARRELEKILLEDSAMVSWRIIEEIESAGPTNVKAYLLKLVNYDRHRIEIAQKLTEKILKDGFKNLPKDVYNFAHDSLYPIFKGIVTKVLSKVTNGYPLNDAEEEDIGDAIDFFFEKITGNNMYWHIIATYIRVLFKEFGHDPKVLYR